MERKKIKWETPELVKLTSPKATGTEEPDCDPGSAAEICGHGGNPETAVKARLR